HVCEPAGRAGRGGRRGRRRRLIGPTAARENADNDTGPREATDHERTVARARTERGVSFAPSRVGHELDCRASLTLLARFEDLLVTAAARAGRSPSEVALRFLPRQRARRQVAYRGRKVRGVHVEIVHAPACPTMSPPSRMMGDARQITNLDPKPI